MPGESFGESGMTLIDKILNIFKLESARALEEKFKEHGYHLNAERHKRDYEEDQRRKREEENATKRLHDSFKIEDMHQFTDIPFEWRWVMQLNHTNGIAWFLLNKNNQFIALSAINYINSILKESENYTGWKSDYYICTENIDFFYPMPMTMNSIPNTFVECVPYTKTGKISKYPAILHFREHAEIHKYYDMETPVYKVYGSLYFMVDGSIGKADLHIDEFWIQLRLHGIYLMVQRIGKNTPNGNVDIYRKKLEK